MTSQSSGGSGSGLPGVTTDGKTPGGEKIAGALTAGDPNAASVPSLHQFYGSVTFSDAVGNNIDDDNIIQANQESALTGDAPVSAIAVDRGGTLNGHDYTLPMVNFDDRTASTAALLRVRKNGTAQLQVDGDGVQVHGKFKTGAAVTHTLGAYSGKSLPIYDESGTLVGYAPCYA